MHVTAAKGLLGLKPNNAEGCVPGTHAAAFPVQVAPSAELLAAAAEVVQAWSGLGSHPNLVIPRGAFVTGELDGAPALVFAHALHPAAITLEQAHLLPGAGGL